MFPSRNECQLHDNSIAIGVTTIAYIVDHADEITTSTLRKFFTSVRKFYESVIAKMLAKFPFKGPVVSSSSSHQRTFILKTAKKVCVGYNISCSSSQILITPVSSKNEKYFIKCL